MEFHGSEAIDFMRLIQTDGARLDKFVAGAILRRLALQPGGSKFLTKNNDDLLAECKILISPKEYCAEFGSQSSKAFFGIDEQNSEIKQEPKKVLTDDEITQAKPQEKYASFFC